MEINSQCVVALTWTLKDSLGETLDILDEPVEFLVGGGDLLAKIDEALQGHEPGAVVELNLEPQDAFGDYDEQRVFLELRTAFPEGLEEGMTIEASALPAQSAARELADALYTVTEIYPEHVVLDGNHPLAGIALRLKLRVESVRDATEEEVGRGSAGSGFFKIEPQAPGGTSIH